MNISVQFAVPPPPHTHTHTYTHVYICAFMSCAGLQVAARAGIYAILDHLGFSEFENPDDSPMARLRFRWLPHSVQSIPTRGQLI